MFMEILVGLIILSYFVLFFIASLNYRGISSLKELAGSKNTLSIFALTSGLVMTHYGAGFILGGTELGYLYGLRGIAYSFAAATGVLLLGFFISRKTFQRTHRQKIKTIPELLFKRYGDYRLSLFASLLSIVALITIVAAQLFALIGVVEALKLPSILILGVVAFGIGLTVFKGVEAVFNLSKLHLLVISIGTFIVLIFTLNAAPISSEISSEFGIISPLTLFGIILPTILYTLIGQDFHQKIFSANSFKSARIATIISAIILILVGIIPVLIGLESRNLISVAPSFVLPTLILNILPPILQGIILAAIIAAVLGSTQALVSAAVSHVSEDLLKKSSLSPIIQKRISLTSVFVFPFLALCIALFSDKGIVGLLTTAYTLYTAGMFIPVLFCFYGDNINSLNKSIFVASLLGVISAVFFEIKIIDFPLPSIVPALILAGIYLIVVTHKKSHGKDL